MKAKQTNTQTNKQTNKQTDRQTNKQTNKQENKQGNQQASKKTHDTTTQHIQNKSKTQTKQTNKQTKTNKQRKILPNIPTGSVSWSSLTLDKAIQVYKLALDPTKRYFNGKICSSQLLARTIRTGQTVRRTHWLRSDWSTNYRWQTSVVFKEMSPKTEQQLPVVSQFKKRTTDSCSE